MLNKSNYKWYILILAALSYGVIAGLERMGLPVLFKEISTDLGLSTVSIGIIWGMDPLAGVLIGLPAGLLADRFGIKRTLTVVCILAGIFGALRGFSTDFITMSIFMFLFGLTGAMTPVIVPKTTALWFSRKYLGLTNALLNFTWAAGSMTATMLSATVLSPLLGGWRNVLFFLGVPAFIIGILWIVTGREPDKTEVVDSSATSVPLKKALSQVIHIKEVWIMGLVQLCVWGAYTGSNGYIPLYLRNIGWAPAAADAAITILTGSLAVGMIPMMLLANRLRADKGILIFSLVILAASLVILSFVQDKLVYPVLIISGFLRSASTPLCSVLIFKIKGVGSTYAGSAMGLTTTLGMIGSFAAPPLGNSLASLNDGSPFIFWGVLTAIALPLLLLIKEASSLPSSSRRS